MDQAEEYQAKMNKLNSRKKEIIEQGKVLLSEYRKIEKEEQQLSDAEFIRTGRWSSKGILTINITYKDLLRDLVRKTEGSMIKPEDLDEAGKN